MFECFETLNLIFYKKGLSPKVQADGPKSSKILQPRKLGEGGCRMRTVSFSNVESHSSKVFFQNFQPK